MKARQRTLSLANVVSTEIALRAYFEDCDLDQEAIVLGAAGGETIGEAVAIDSDSNVRNLITSETEDSDDSFVLPSEDEQ